MIILGRSHSSKNQGATTPEGLSEWIIADRVNGAIQDELKYRCNNDVLVLRIGGTLRDRIETLQNIGKTAKYDCAIECHCNHFSRPAMRGFSVLAWHRSSASIHLADCILEQLARVWKDTRNLGVCKVAADHSTPERDTIRWVGANREYDEATWLGLLADTPGPAVIVEAGYLSNPADARWITEPINRISIGWAIGRGIDNWMRERKVPS